VNADRRIAWLDRVETIGRHIETAVLTVLLSVLIVLAFAQIILRNVFSAGLSWGDGSTQLLVLWIAVAGAVAATRDRRHLSIDLSSRFLPATWYRWTRVLVDLFAMSITGIFAWHAARFVMDSKAFGDSLLGSLPAWPFQLVLPVGFALIAYRFAIHALRGALNR
jgi:TRAP-type C4-dicarboxylate transport system permease small subunit